MLPRPFAILSLSLLLALPARAVDDDVLELSGPVLDRVARGLVAQAALHDSLTAVLGRNEAVLEQFDECMNTAPERDPRLQQVQDSLSSTSDDDPAYARLQGERATLAAKACGAAGARFDTMREDLWRLPPQRGQAASALTARQYRIAAERVVAFCKLQREPGDENLAGYVFNPKEKSALAARCTTLAKTLASIE